MGDSTAPNHDTNEFFTKIVTFQENLNDINNMLLNSKFNEVQHLHPDIFTLFLQLQNIQTDINEFKNSMYLVQMMFPDMFNLLIMQQLQIKSEPKLGWHTCIYFAIFAFIGLIAFMAS